MSDYQIENREWWVQRWLELLDSYRFKKRLERARIYAREGNVLSIDFEKAKAFSLVQGSEAEPYKVSLRLDPFRNEDWEYVISTMSQKAIFSAQLLAGMMPENIEAVFTQAGLNLFPFTLSDIRSHCSCPDKANPCKHIGAVYYQLADRFSEDPFVIFQLRGRTKEQILEALRQKRAEALKNNPLQENIKAVENKQKKNRKASQKTTKKDPISLQSFWQYNEPLESSLVVIVPPTDKQTILEILGKIPLPYEEAQLIQQSFQQVYQTTSQKAMMSALDSES